MDADSNSSVGSEKNLSTVATATVMMMSANASSSVSSTASSPSFSLVTPPMMVGVTVNGDGNNHLGGGVGTISSANNGNIISGSSHYSMAGPNSIGSNNMSNHNNKLVTTSGVWGSQPGSNMNTTGSSNTYINGGSNPNANHGSWPQNPSPVSQRQAQGMSSKLGVVPQQGSLLGWGGMAAPDSSMIEDTEMDNGTFSSKVLGGSNSGSGGLQPTNLNTESNGPNNTIMMNTTTTNTTVTSSPLDSTTSPQLSGDCSWGSIGGGNGGPLANGNCSLAPQHPQGDTGAFGRPWGAAAYPVDKGPLNADTVNPQISSTAAFKSNNNHNNTGAVQWDQGPTSNPNQPQSNLSWCVGSNQTPGSTGQTPGNGNPTTMGPPAGIPRPWGSSASSSSSSSSSSTSNSKMSNGEWGSTAPCNSNSDVGSQKGSSANNGWKSLEDDAIGMGGAGGSGGGQGPGSVIGGWGRSGGSEGSAESSGGRSSSDRDNSQSKGGNRRKVIHTTPIPPPLTHAEVDPRVLSNTGWGQTPIRQNTAWDVNTPAKIQDLRKQSGVGSGWSTAAPAAPSQNSGGRNVTLLFSDHCGSLFRSNTWTNTPKVQQGWGSGSESWGGNVDGPRSGSSKHWGEPQKGGGSVGLDSDSDRSGSGCWSEPSRTNTSSSNAWAGSGGSNAPDQSTPNPGSNWGDSATKPNPQNNSKGWGEHDKNNHGAQNWSESGSKPSNEWGKDPEPRMSRANQGSNKPTGTCWLGGPMPTVGPKEEVSTGWEEPSPESIRRRMEIDDGTAAWGDPGKYGGGSVNMWNKTSRSEQETTGPPQQNQPHSAHNSHKDSSSWREPAAGPPVTLDNGTSAWGKPTDSSAAWEEPSRKSRESVWDSQHKSGPKPMETWCSDVSMSNSWDQEEEVEIGMWSNNQQDNRSHDQNTWNYKHKTSNKMSKPVTKQDDWSKPLISQFNNMNFTRDSPDESMKLVSGMAADKRMDTSSMDFNGGVGKNPGSRHQFHKESAVDRSPYFDKVAAQGRVGPQAQPPPQPSLRNQVPPPILPSQVPPSLLKYPGANSCLNPLLAPQQMAMINQLSQLNQLNQINQLQTSIFCFQMRPMDSSPSLMQPPRHLDPSLPKQVLLWSLARNRLPVSSIPSGLTSNLNVPLDMGVGGGAVNYKEPPQSRLKKLWAADPLEQNSKTGAMSTGLRLEDSPFYDFLSPGPSPLSPPGQSIGSVGDCWPPRANSPPPHGNTVTWPPEFRPGEPWKGYPNIDPETDPYVTPGSVINTLSINTVRDTDHLRDRNNGPSSSLNTTMPSNSAWSSIRASGHSGSLTSTAQSTSARPSESKWSPGGGSVSNSSLAHELWKVPLSPKPLPVPAPSRPPPGLTSQKPNPASSGWDGSTLRLGGWGSTESRYTPGSSWGESSSSGRTQWLVLKNLTPQIDGSTLRTLCMQHGPLITFHLNLPHGNAVVCYSSKDEAAKAQKSLHMCVLGNTTILAEFASEEEINRFFAQGQSLATPSSGWQAIGSSQSRMDQSHPFPSRTSEPNQWGSGFVHRSSLWGGSNYSSSLWGSPSGTEPGGISSPSPISSFLPVDHLTGGGDSM
uniref:Trinucleotide repeat containing adaptor 6A n=1 Tax=Nothobranchius furzeri TaxID=105023 RepID=A0A8C6KJ98_NOTFU